MGHYVTNCHEEGQEIVIRQYYVQSLDEKVDPDTYDGIMAMKHYKESHKEEFEELKERAKKSSKGNKQEKSKERANNPSKENNKEEFKERTTKTLKENNKEQFKDVDRDQSNKSSSEQTKDGIQEQSIDKKPRDCKTKSDEKKKSIPKKEKSIEEIQKEQGRNKRRQIKRLRGILNENFTSNALSVVLTFSPEALSNGIIQKELKKEVAKFFRRIRKRIEDPFKYVYIISTQDITYSTGEVNEAHPHVHMIIEGDNFELRGEDIAIRTKKGIDISLEEAWGKGLVKAKKVDAAIDKMPDGKLDIDEIHYFKDNATPADFEADAKYFIDQSIASFGMETRMWDTSIGLSKPDKGFTVNDKYDSDIRIPDGLKLQSETEYGTLYKYKEKRYYKTKPGMSIDSVLKANPRFR